ncbi:uncharacterized protein LOC122435525 [Cervus canadensis]|uniref:uncharacterized protein LOC122435525 n=1 Tax=Cervus canadensis TaxID=1574408 RepID=UPI001CA37B99|nr:uncharacterized protein LOC122435525 [Cervus canadensis]
MELLEVEGQVGFGAQSESVVFCIIKCEKSPYNQLARKSHIHASEYCCGGNEESSTSRYLMCNRNKERGIGDLPHEARAPQPSRGVWGDGRAGGGALRFAGRRERGGEDSSDSGGQRDGGRTCGLVGRLTLWEEGKRRPPLPRSEETPGGRGSGRRYLLQQRILQRSRSRLAHRPPTATLRAGGSVEAKTGASRSTFRKIRVNLSTQTQGSEKPQMEKLSPKRLQHP